MHRNTQSLTVTDMFCGADGSSIGVTAAGASVRLAMNHWPVAPGSAAPVAHSPRDPGGELRKRRTARAYGVYLGAGIRAGQRPVAPNSGSVAGKPRATPYTMTPGIFGELGAMPSDHAACRDAGQRAGPQLRSEVFEPPGPEPNKSLTCRDADP